MVVGHPEDVVVVEQHYHPTLEMLVKTAADSADFVAVVFEAQVTVVPGTVEELAVAVAVVVAVPLGLETVAGSSHVVVVAAVAAAVVG